MGKYELMRHSVKMTMSEQQQYAICIKNDGHEESLDVLQTYEVLSDPEAEGLGLLRVVDEDEDYLWPASWFRRIGRPDELDNSTRR